MSRQTLMDSLFSTTCQAGYRLFSPFAEQLFQSLDLQPKPILTKTAPTKPRKSPYQQLKTDIQQWFLKLTIADRQRLCQLSDPALVEMLLRHHNSQPGLKMSLQRAQDTQTVGLLRTRQFPPAAADKVEAQRRLVQSFRITCLGRVTLHLRQEAVRDSNTFLQLLDIVSTKQIFEYGSKMQPHSTGNPLWFSNLAFNTLGQWLCHGLEKVIFDGWTARANEIWHSDAKQLGSELMTYYSSLNEDRQLLILTDQVRLNLPKEKLLSSVLSMHPAHMTSGGLEILRERMAMLEDWYNEEKSRKIMAVEESQKKPKKKSNEKKEKKKKPNKKTKGKESKDEQKDETKDQQKEGPRDECRQNQPEVEAIKSMQAVEPAYEIIEQTAVASDETIEALDIPCLNTPSNKSPSYESQSLQQNSQETSECPIELSEKGEQVSEAATDINQIKRKKTKKKKKIPEQLVQSIFHYSLESNLRRFVDSLSIASNQLLEARVLVFERIRHFVMKLYGEYTVDAKLFGSNAAGLALPTSDIDILMTGFSLDTQQESIGLLDHLSNQLKRMKWVVKCDTYLHAKVPIIKLEVDPNIGFLETTDSRDHIPILKTIRQTLELKKSLDNKIKVDITVEAKKADYSHLGCMSTEFMKGWLENIPQLNPILMTLKYLLSVHSLNRPFKGGLSSYCLMIMVTAYMKESMQHYKMQGAPPRTLSENFLGLLRFYAEQFDSQNTSLSLLANQGCFFKTGEEKFFLNIVDPLNGRMMTANCSEWPRIKAEFKRLVQVFEAMPEQIEQDLRQVQTIEIKNMQLKKKQAEKWAKKYDEVWNLESKLKNHQ